MKICAEEQLFSHHTDWNHQNCCIKNKLLERRIGEISLNVMDIERAEITLTRYIQKSVFGKIYTKLSLDAEKYAKESRKLKTHNLNVK